MTKEDNGQIKPFKKRAGIGGWLLLGILLFAIIAVLNREPEHSGDSSLGTQETDIEAGIDLTDHTKQEAWILVSKDGVRKRLKDPASAKFKDTFFVYWNDTPIVCGYVNSKNGAGGYSGFQKFVASGDAMVYFEKQVSDFYKVWNEMCMK